MTDVVLIQDKAPAKVVLAYTWTSVVRITPPSAPVGVVIASPLARLVFPDADPHIDGAGYWVNGVLTRSAG